MNIDSNKSILHGRLRGASNGLFWAGLALAALGVAAILFPIFSTLVATVLVGWALLFSGIVAFVCCFSIRGTGPFFAALLFSLLCLASGLFLLFNLLAGAVALTLLLGVIFVFQGAFELFFAFEMEPLPGWVGMLISGIISILLACLIAIGWPAISAIVLGVILGVNFLSTGISYMLAARLFRG